MKFFFITTLLLPLTFMLKAQNLDRVSLSSGGFSNDKMNAVIGELFIATFNGQNGQASLETGSASSTTYTGGVILAPTEISSDTEKPLVIFYPNPVEETLTFSVSEINGRSIDVFIFDMTGKAVFESTTETPEKTELNVSGLNAGPYILKVETSDNLNIPSFTFIKL